MTFISSSEVKNIYVIFKSCEAKNEIYKLFHVTRWNESQRPIHDKTLDFLSIIYKVKRFVFNVVRYRGLRGQAEFYYSQ